MRLQSLAVLAALTLLPPVSLAAEHSPLVPRPQEVKYGTGSIGVRGLSVRLPSSAAPEDRFAASTLAGCLSERAGSPVTVSEGGPGEGTIALQRTGGIDPLPVPGEHPGRESREAYSLKVGPQQAEIRAASSAGLFYGAETMCQLAEGAGAETVLPEVEIHDWPSLAYRGTMVDMSHGPLPTEEEVKRQIDFMARWKANQYYFYNEASVQLDGYPLLNPGGRFSKQEVRNIVAYGRERHVDVLPCLELYAHLHDLFRVEKYADLSDLPHGTEFDPHNPKIKALLADWVGQFAQLFPSPFVHIGFDETFQIEMAAKQPGAGEPARLFIDQLGYVTRLFQQNGKTVMAWGDIMAKYPAILGQLPPGLIAIAWEYDPGTEQHYEPRLGPLARNHVPHLIASGVTAWNQVSPDFDRSFANIDTFLAVGRKSGALGLINTIWTDDAQELIRATWPGIAYGAAAAWQPGPTDERAFFSDYTRLMYPPAAAPEVAAALEDLAKSEVELQKVLGEETMIALWGDPFAPAILKSSTEHLDDLRQARLLAEDAEEHLDRALSSGADSATLNSLLFSSRLLDYAGQKFQTAPELEAMWQRLGPRRPGGDLWWNLWESQVVYQDHSRLVDLMDAISELRAAYRSAWLAEYRPYRLACALGRWDAEYEYWRGLQSRLLAFSGSAHEGDVLPPLASFTHPQ